MSQFLTLARHLKILILDITLQPQLQIAAWDSNQQKFNTYDEFYVWNLEP